MRVLLAGPLPPTTTSLAGAFRSAGITALRCEPDELVASARIDEPDVVLLDPTASRGASWRAATALRRAGIDAGLILLADADPPIALYETWMALADDCRLGLLDPREVIAHCRAVDRRRRGHVTESLEVQGVAIDPTTGEVVVGDRRARLAPTPRRFLGALLRRAGTRVPRETILLDVYGDEDGPEHNTLSVMLVSLRRQLAAIGAPPDLIDVRRSEGYLVRRGPHEGSAAR